MRSINSGLIVVALAVLFAFPSARNAMAQDNSGQGSAAVAAPDTTVKPDNGKVMCTAAIKSDGSVLNCKKCNPANTLQLSTGHYQVEFTKPCTNILAANGWSRWVQADALNDTSTTAYCTTADRNGDANAIFVECIINGSPANTPFYLFVAH